jgi:peptidyl-prolyl cis-trans isomerase D
MLKLLRMGNKRIKVVWWIIIVLTVFTFVGLFVTAFDPRYAQKATHAVASVDGEPVTQTEYMSALNDQRLQFQRSTGAEPAEQENRMLEAQAWRAAVIQHMVASVAANAGLKAYDPEIVHMLRTSPPASLVGAPEFQTDGKFDEKKYMSAIGDPRINWAPFEDVIRHQLPGRKLEERLAASLKLSQHELFSTFHDRYDLISATAIHVAPMTTGTVPPVTDADIDTVYQRFRNRMSGAARVQLEVLRSAKKYSPEDMRAARAQAQSLADRARKGEDFAALARDYSEGPGARQGGEINRQFQPADFGPELAPKMAVANKGDVLDPFEESGRFIVVKVLDKTQTPGAPAPIMKVAQIQIQARMSDEARKAQFDKMDKIRTRAKTIGFGKAATEGGLATTKTNYFDYSSGPPEVQDIPEAADWAVGSKVGAVSRVYENPDAFVIVSVSDKHDAGPGTKTEMMDGLRQLAELRKRVLMTKSTADKIATMLAQGQTLEQAAAATGATLFKVDSMSRVRTDPRLQAVPEVAGAAFGVPIGKTTGPIETPAGWFFIRADAKMPADTSRFVPQMRGQLTQEILQRRQQDFFTNWLAESRQKAKIEDLRAN